MVKLAASGSMFGFLPQAHSSQLLPAAAHCPRLLQGFYGVYRELFETLAQQEAAAWEDSEAAAKDSRERLAPAPSFGTSSSSAAEVFGFYSSWQSFVTFKHFAWADQYNPATAPNRQVE